MAVTILFHRTIKCKKKLYSKTDRVAGDEQLSRWRYIIQHCKYKENNMHGDLQYSYSQG